MCFQFTIQPFITKASLVTKPLGLVVVRPSVGHFRVNLVLPGLIPGSVENNVWIH